MPLRSALLFGALVIIPSVLGAQAATAPDRARQLPLKRRPQPTTAAINETDLMTRVYLFADDSMQGREAGYPGAIKGTAYIAAELRRLGLVPAGENGTYFQNVPFVARTLDSSTTITSRDATFAAYRDFVAIPFRGALPRATDGAQVIYGGVLGDTVHALTPQQAEGKFVIVRNPAGVLNRIGPTNRLAGAAAVALVGTGDLSANALATGHAPTLTLPPAPGAPSALVTLALSQSAAERLLGAPLEGMSVGTTGGVVQGNLRFLCLPAKPVTDFTG